MLPTGWLHSLLRASRIFNKVRGSEHGARGHCSLQVSQQLPLLALIGASRHQEHRHGAVLDYWTATIDVSMRHDQVKQYKVGVTHHAASFMFCEVHAMFGTGAEWLQMMANLPAMSIMSMDWQPLQLTELQPSFGAVTHTLSTWS